MLSRNFSSIEKLEISEHHFQLPNYTSAEYCKSIWEQFDIPAPRVALLPQASRQFGNLRKIFEVVDSGDADAIVLTDERHVLALDDFRSARGLCFVPVVNATGRSSHVTDVDFDVADPQSIIKTAGVISKFAERRSRLSPKFMLADSPASRLLAHLFLSGETLTPVRVPESKYFFAMKGFHDTNSTVLVAEALANRGWLERHFVDRHHQCDKCGSHRLVVREECPTCRSANLDEAKLIHHYSCAQIGPEVDFQRDNALICPKCSKQLRNYGKDYDKPGSVQICGECRHTTSEPAIGFVCQDCGAGIDGQRVATVDLHSYALTDYATYQLTDAARQALHSPPQLRDCPDGLQKELRSFTNDLPVLHDCVVAELIYEARDEIVRRRGEATFAALRRLFAENLQGHLAGMATVHPSTERDFVLFFHLTQSDRDTDAQVILNMCEAVLSDHLQPRLRILWGGSDGAIA
ncbi:DNA-directed RNA polymerase subunit RPC12/RpoP [Aminobacter niigataensis]|uniref:DNA-directed RNA polymerase subunit RPC12/RpoP n=1 Tax=Aminobacter niigataensis TaxID=83265 RepID=A0ABR6KWV8_9HYPH|nr:DNA-directed RNA polymerase subunit RPC12/RpoP [Aminobacter niigataensis]